MGVRQVFIDEQTNKAKALFRLFRRKLANEGFGDLAIEDVIREGMKSDEIVKLIEEDEDIALLVLGAAIDTKGPGPLVSSLAAGKTAGSFPSRSPSCRRADARRGEGAGVNVGRIEAVRGRA